MALSASAAPTAKDVSDSATAHAPRSVNTVNGLIHLYRAEVGRLTAYRARMDTTTNWAITSSALVATFALGNEEVSHAAFLFLMFINYYFLMLEGRRYRAFEGSRQRAELLERTFYPELLGEPTPPDWPEKVANSLKQPTEVVSTLGAIGWRLRRSYLGIYGAILFAWIAKLDLVLPSGFNLWTLVERAHIGSIPGAVVFVVVIALYAWLAVLAFSAPHRYAYGSEEWRDPSL